MKIARFINNTETPYNNLTGYNLGDSILAICSDYVLHECGFDQEDILDIPFYGNTSNIKEPCKMMLYGHFGRQYDMAFMTDKNIIPLFIGIGLKDSFLTDEEITYFKKFEPVLCRDEFTKNVLNNYNIEAFFFGCISLLLPERENIQSPSKIYLVDINEDYINLFPDSIKEKSEIVSHKLSLVGTNTNGYKIAQAQLDNYKNTAKLVITSRLHCMAPCVAMGIPTIAFGDNFSFRYSFIDAFVSNYNSSKINDITPLQDINLSELRIIKTKMMNAVKSMLNNCPDYDTLMEIDSFYANRHKWNYFDKIRELLADFFSKSNNNEYIIWGASSGGYGIKACIECYFPKYKCSGVIDKEAIGLFGGIRISKPTDINWSTNQTPIIITTLSGRQNVSLFLTEKGLTEGKDFIFVHENM